MAKSRGARKSKATEYCDSNDDDNENDKIYAASSSIAIRTVTLKDLKLAQSGSLSTTRQQCLVRIPSQKQRHQIYEEACRALVTHEVRALPRHGKRPWKVVVQLVENADGIPLFRWFHGNLELACVPHLLEKIPTDGASAGGQRRNNSDTHYLDSSDEEEGEEEMPVSSAHDLSERTPSMLSKVAYYYHPVPSVKIKWISPDNNKVYNSRKAAKEHAALLRKRDLLVNRVVRGRGKGGQLLTPHRKITRKDALEAGYYRFLRDGLWVVGQEEAWREARQEEWEELQEEKKKRKQEREAKRKQKEEARIRLMKEKEEEEQDGACGQMCLDVEYMEKGELSNNSHDDTKASVGQASISIADEKIQSIRVLEEYKTSGDSTPECVVSNSSHEDKKASVGQTSISIADEKIQSIRVLEEYKTSGDSTPECVVGGNCFDIQGEMPSATKKHSEQGCKLSVVTPVDTDDAASDATSSNMDTIPAIPKLSSTPLDAAKADTTSAKKAASESKNPKKRSRSMTTAPTHWRMNQKQIDLCYDAAIQHYESVMYTVKARALHLELADGFDVLRERGRGRYDMELPAFDLPTFSFLTDIHAAPWMPIVRKILGDDVLLIHKGVFLSMPGSGAQVYHQDGPHLTTQAHRPCHAVNVFVPLVDLTHRHGPTEFCLGTHILGNDGFNRDHVETPEVPAGTPIIFDYRLGHRGLGNSSRSCRPVVYCTYAASRNGKEFRDSVNFSTKRYHKIGEFVDKPISREERVMKRKKRQEAEKTTTTTTSCDPMQSSSL